MSAEDAGCDLLVLGGGLAGLAAAREAAARGLRVTLLEGAERLGGRTFGQEWRPHGLTLDMGGTWILPSFTAAAAEIARYGLATYRNADPAWGVLAFGAGVERRLSPSERETAQLRAFRQALEALLATGDALSVSEALERCAAGDFVRHWVAATQRYLGGAPLDRIDAAHALQSWEDLLDPDHYRIRLAGTMSALIERLAGDCRARDARLELGQEITAITGSDGGLTALTAEGRRFTAAELVIALPINTLRHLRLELPLPDALRRFIARGHVGDSQKFWLLLEGLEAPFRLFSSDGPLAYLRSDQTLPEGRVLAVGFGLREELRDRPPAEIAGQVAHLLGARGAEAFEDHDWAASPWSRGTWFVPHPGQYRELRQLPLACGRVRLAGGDLSPDFPGTIEGALRTGLAAGSSFL